MTSALDNSGQDRLLHAMREIATPALVVDEPALDRNIAAMADRVKKAGKSLRPHAKTHKCPVIAAKQIEAGAVGVCCATLAEMQAMTDAGIAGLLLTAPIQDAAKIHPLVELARKSAITVSVDHLSQVDALDAASATGNASIGICIDIDVGQRRTGVCTIEDAIEIAKRVDSSNSLKLVGVQGYAGHAQHIPDFTERSHEAARVAALLKEYVAALHAKGFKTPIVSGSGTGTHDLDLKGEPFTELQAGSYVFMDADYARIQGSEGGRLPFECSLFILTTVTSANRSGQVTIDAGTKSLAVNGPAPHIIYGAPQGTGFQFAGDEHGTLLLPEGSKAPRLGDRILMSVTHCDPTINLFSALQAVSHNGDLKKWPILGRN